jgi:hypothetical protein
MDAFPFTEEEWEAVREAARGVINATKAEDPDLRAARFADLQSVLHWLRGRHGDHPTLLETEADFSTSPSDAAGLYRRAEREAAARGLPVLSIRLALARVMVDLGEPDAAREALLACREELTFASERHCETWTRLFTACEGQVEASVG